MDTKKYKFSNYKKILILCQKFFFQKKNTFLEVYKIDTFCIHFTQNLMLIPNLSRFPGFLQYTRRYRPWKSQKEWPKSQKWRVLGKIQDFLVSINYFWSRLHRTGTGPLCYGSFLKLNFWNFRKKRFYIFAVEFIEFNAVLLFSRFWSLLYTLNYTLNSL